MTHSPTRFIPLYEPADRALHFSLDRADANRDFYIRERSGTIFHFAKDNNELLRVIIQYTPSQLNSITLGQQP